MLFPDKAIYLEQFQKSMHRHKLATAEYSQEILDCVPLYELKYFRVPCLAQMFLGLCRRFVERGDTIGAIGMEQLIDGMDIDLQWLATCLPGIQEHDIALARSFIMGKQSRIDDISFNQVTSFIRDKEEARMVRNIPGRDIVFRACNATISSGGDWPT